MTTCAICGETFDGYGNNPAPIASGRACDDCDESYVIPARIHLASATTRTSTRQIVNFIHIQVLQKRMKQTMSRFKEGKQ